MQSFEMTCYYVAPICPHKYPHNFSAEQADKAELKEWDLIRVFENLPI